MKTIAELKEWVTEDATWEAGGELHGRHGLDLAGAVIRKAAPMIAELQTENMLFKSALIEIAGLPSRDIAIYDAAKRAYRIAREALNNEHIPTK